MKKESIAAALLSTALLLAGCAANAAEEQIPGQAAGADWRTWGWVNDAGVMVQNGEKTDVLVCVFTDGIMLYLDDDTQTVFGAAEYPEKREDARETYVRISLDDQDGDGSGDICAVFEDADGKQTALDWLWNAQTGEFVYQTDESK